MSDSQGSFDMTTGANGKNIGAYKFEPIKGYPMLNWRGKRPFTSTQFYPAQLREQYGEAVDGWRNKIYWGDNSQVMSHLLKEYRGQVKLVYIDPPFDSKAEYKMAVALRGRSATSDQSAFEEKQYGDIWTNDEYLQFVHERLILVRELLSPDGSLYVHVDWHKGHYLRCLLDEIFGAEQFRNEIIWCYTGPGSPGMRQFNRKHDTILWYSKSGDWVFNDKDIRVPHNEKTRDNFKSGLQGSGFISDTYDLDEKGKIPEDWWQMAIAGRYPVDGIKRVGYPTEKPWPLIERIVLTSSNPGDLVFDCFMGSGTTQAVAMKLGRRFIGADINLGAVQITTKRLIQITEDITAALPTLGLSSAIPIGSIGHGIGATMVGAIAPTHPAVVYAGFEVYNVNHYDIFRNPVQAKDLLCEALELQRLPQGHLFDGERDGRLWKVMPVNRIATRADLDELVAGLDYKAFAERQAAHPNQPVEKITLVCMGHEPDLAACLVKEVHPYKLDVEVLDILRDKQELQFKRDAEAKVAVFDGELVIEAFYPMNLLQKLSLQKEAVEDWRELVESVMVDWNYDGAVLTPVVADIPERNELVTGRYRVPEDAGTIRVKITDLLSESLEVEVVHG